MKFGIDIGNTCQDNFILFPIGSI